MVGTEQSTALRYNEDTSGRVLNASGREHLLKPYLPSAPKQEDTAASIAGRFRHTSRIRPAIRQLLHWTLFAIIHTLFSVYIRLRQVYHAIVDRLFALLYYHHRTPELIQRDVKGLSKVPNHLSVVLELSPEGGKKDRLETLMNDACEVAAWSACSGIPMLSIYEQTGILKSTIPHLHRRIERTLTAYYGSTNPQKPTFSLRAPHLPSYSPPESPEPATNGANGTTHSKRPHLNILLISTTDGRQTLVDLTRTLASMAQDSKIQPSDISDELIDAEITESVMGEPDLLLLFGDRVTLKGYPPWQVRLTEIYGVQDHVGGVEYAVFLRGLYRFAKAKMNFGRFAERVSIQASRDRTRIFTMRRSIIQSTGSALRHDLLSTPRQAAPFICATCRRAAIQAPTHASRTPQRTFVTSPSRLQESSTASQQPSSQTGANTQAPQTHYDFFPSTFPAGQPPHSPFTPDLKQLKKEYIQLQAKSHPDHAPAGHERQAEALSMRINEAYRTLSDPLKRAQYLLALRGIDVEDESAKMSGGPLLMEVMEAREAVDEVEDEAGLGEIKAENDGRIAQSVGVLDEAFAREDVERAAEEAIRLRYWMNIEESIRGWEKGKGGGVIHH
ncbi:hypothetical protein D0865_05400 [Hortaea werneckii]|uniref:J domain-containing protein n=1 Tax=Hortaea werneckii TaxID=91943 RepID=A0A3M7CMU8_HORWE|nr:hypothetical protein D0865_05400 [Hortaea werneckii]